MFKLPPREQNSNKGTFGKVLNICGSKDYIGAAYLATVSSLKIGAGFSALYSAPEVLQSVSTMLPEAVYLRNFPNVEDFSAVLIGCGLGNSVSLFKDTIELLHDKFIPVVIDADGLNILAGLDNINLPKKLIITPHPLEAARLLGCSLEEVLSDINLAAKKLTDKYNCITVLKTHRTVVFSNEIMYINQHGNSALAKAGSGDVLAGIIAGLLAQKMPLFEAARLGVYLHSRAGEIASEELTEYCVLASDIPKYLHNAVKELIAR